MASGSFENRFHTYSNGKAYTLRVEWVSTASTDTNSSTITATVKFIAPYSLYVSKRYNNKLIINGVEYGYTAPAISTDSSANATFVTITTDPIPHNDDGTLSVNISATYRLNATITETNYGTITASGTAVLDNIPRAATITAAPNFNDEANPILSYSNPAGNTVTSLQAGIALANTTNLIMVAVYRDISKTGNSYTFNLTAAEREVLRARSIELGSTSVPVTYMLRTVIGGKTYNNTSAAKTVTIINANVGGSLSLTVDETSKNLTGSYTTAIRGYSDVTAVLTTQTYKGASVASSSITHGQNTITGPSATFYDVVSGSFTWAVADNRKTTATDTATINLIDYIKLTCNLKAKINVSGTATLNVEGNVFNNTFGAVTNTLTLQYRYRESGGTWSDWIAFVGTKNGNTYSGSVDVNGLDYRLAYGFQARAVDRITDISTEERVIIALPTFDWGAEDFNFNVPVYIQGGVVPSIVESASDSEGWTWRLWSDGVAECWAKRQVTNVNITTGWGNLYTSGGVSGTNLIFPITFTEVPVVNASLTVMSAAAILVPPGGTSNTTSTTRTGAFEFVRPSTLSNGTFTINYQVKGRWK